MESKKYQGISFDELKAQLIKDGYDLRGCDDEKTNCLLCLNAGIVMVDGHLISLDNIISIAYRKDEWWDSYDGYESEKADVYGTYETKSESPTVYDYEESGESTSYTVVYMLNGEKQEIKLQRDGYVRYWMLGLLQYVKKRGNEYKKKHDNEQQRETGKSV